MVGFSGDQKPLGIEISTINIPPTKWVVFDGLGQTVKKSSLAEFMQRKYH